MMSPSTEARVLASRFSTGSSLYDSIAATSDGKSKKSKKVTNVLGFLALKEPSTKAWQEFADSEREKAKQRGKTLDANQRLPQHVPRVNSRWNGMPDNFNLKRADSKLSKHTSATSSDNQHEWDFGSTTKSYASSHAQRPFSTRTNSSNTTSHNVAEASIDLTRPLLGGQAKSASYTSTVQSDEPQQPPDEQKKLDLDEVMDSPEVPPKNPMRQATFRSEGAVALPSPAGDSIPTSAEAAQATIQATTNVTKATNFSRPFVQ